MASGHKSIRMVCLDFDGTCVDYEDGAAHLNEEVIALLNDLAEIGLEWCSNSGRTLESQLEVLADSRKRGLRNLPSALLCGESFFYEREGEEYRSDGSWNDRAHATLSVFHQEVRNRKEAELAELGIRYNVAERVFVDAATAFLLPTSDPAILNRCLAELDALVRDFEHGYASRNGGWLFVAHREFGKGRVLQAFLAHRELQGVEVLVVGDNLNDVDMLDGSVSPHVGCPSNSLPEVVEIVRRARGFVSEREGPAGTLEVIRHFLELGSP